MNRIDKAAAAGVAFFALMLMLFVGVKIDQTTIAILCGLLMGAVVASATAIALIAIGRGERQAQPSAPQATQPRAVPDAMTWVTHNHYSVTVYQVTLRKPREDYAQFELLTTVGSQLQLPPAQALRLIETDQVQFIEGDQK